MSVGGRGGGLTEAEAEAKVTELKAAGRYQADVWA